MYSGPSDFKFVTSIVDNFDSAIHVSILIVTVCKLNLI
jgi:hypothetical protein